MVMKPATLLVMLVSCAAAQPPGVIRVVRNGSIQPYAHSGAAVNVLGMSAISGSPENWLIELHDSFGSVEDLAARFGPAPSGVVAPLGDDLLPASSRTLIAVYRPELSYRPDQASQVWPAMRYLDVVVYRIRPGSEADFAKILKLRDVGLDSVNLDRPEVAYQVISGSPSGTYLLLAPLTSLRVFDDARAIPPVYAEATAAEAKKLADDTEIVRERLWFRIQPRLSYVSDEFAAADPGFWRPAAK